MVAGLKSIDGVKVATPTGAFYCIAELPVDSAEKFAQWILEEFEDQKETVMVAPAAGFYATKGLGEKEIRMAYVLKKEDLVRSVALLKLALQQYNA